MPVKLRLELVSPVRTHLLDTEREFFNDVIDEVDGIFLSMPVIDLQSTYASSIIHGGVRPVDEDLPGLSIRLSRCRHRIALSLMADTINTVIHCCPTYMLTTRFRRISVLRWYAGPMRMPSTCLVARPFSVWKTCTMCPFNVHWKIALVFVLLIGANVWWG